LQMIIHRMLKLYCRPADARLQHVKCASFLFITMPHSVLL
jgi:hypothetical protein